MNKRSYTSVLLLVFFFCINPFYSQTPKVEILTSGTKTSIRGLSVVNDNIVWISGSNGMVARSNDGGKEWKWFDAKKFVPVDDSLKNRIDFRDIEAFDGATAIIMAVASPAYILKTNDGGETWKVVYENKDSGMFLDAMEFWNEQSGIVIGDPVKGKFFVARTFDGGSNWQDIPFDKRPVADSGEACFAASGTNIRALDKDEAVFVSGGLKSRMFTKNDPSPLPITQGKETTGANSIAVFDNKKIKGGKIMAVVGGDFNADTSRAANCFVTKDGGMHWIKPKTSPHGYRSCVEYVAKDQLVSCGLNGVDYSIDGGLNWSWISKEGFHVCRKAKDGKAVFFAGGNGRIGKLVLK
jgi:photosystem II stability/assembly factor-like uncharacterized protein